MRIGNMLNNGGGCRQRIIGIMVFALLLGVGMTGMAVPTGLDKNGHLEAVGSSAKKGFSFVQLENGVQLHIGEPGEERDLLRAVHGSGE